MDAPRHPRSTLLFGLGLVLTGLVCLGGGIALLTWRLIEPEKAVLLPPSFAVLTEDTPTPGLWGTPLAAPPLPSDPAQVVILPESDQPTPTPTGAAPRATATPVPASATPSGTLDGAPSRPPSQAPSRTPDRIPADTPAPTSTPPLPELTPTAPSAAPLAVAFLPTLPSTAPDRIVIPQIGLDAPVVAVGQHPITIGGRVYSQWDVPNQRAAGWQIGSAPLGQPGNTVLNGHHNIYGEVFRWLVTLKPGAIITLQTHGRSFYYAVVQTMTLAEDGQPVAVRQENARWILPTNDERVTLITCWPYYARTHRLIVIARPLWDVVPPGDIP